MWTFALTLMLAFSQQIQQPDDEVNITGDLLEKDGSLLKYTGDVVVVYQDLRLQANWITYNESTQDLEAGDAVHFTRESEELDGKHLVINLRTKSGVIQKASGNLGPGFFITAAQARRLEDGRYELTDATITNCSEPRMGWMFSVGRTVIDPNEKRVRAANAVFRLERIPLFYFPYLVVPGSDRPRSTGFLIPSTSTSTTKGRSVRQSFYYAINRSADALFTGEYFSERGTAASILFRAVPNPKTNVRIDSLFAQDRKGQGGQSIRVVGYTDFAKSYRAVADMNIVSSLVFRQVYEEGFNLISSPIEQSSGFLTNNQPHSSFNFLYNRSAIFFQDQPSVALRKFPAAEAEVPFTRMFEKAPVYFNLETGYTGLARRDSEIHTPSFAQRYDFYPTWTFPVLANSVVEWSARIGLRETAYTHSLINRQVERNMLNRLATDFGMRVSGPHLERNFGSWRHVIEPVVEYRYISGVNRFQNTIVVDDVDLYANTNELEYSVTNRIMTDREILSWRLAQNLYFDPTFGGAITPGRRNVVTPLLDLTGFAFADGMRHLSPLVSTLRVASTSGVSTDLQIDYDTTQKEFRDAGIISGLNHGQVFSSAAYFFTKRSVIQAANNQLRGLIGYGNNQKRGLSTAFSVSYDVHRSLFQQSTAQVGYNTDCYGLSLEFAQYDIGSRKESRFRFAFTLKDIGSIGTIRPQERLF